MEKEEGPVLNSDATYMFLSFVSLVSSVSLSLGNVCFILFNATFFFFLFSSQKFRFLLSESEEMLIFWSSFNLLLESFTSRHN